MTIEVLPVEVSDAQPEPEPEPEPEIEDNNSNTTSVIEAELVRVHHGDPWIHT